MSHNHTKSDNERLYPALPILRIDENRELDDEAATTNENFEVVPPNPEIAGPAAGETAEIHANADMITQSEPGSNATKINQSPALLAETGETRVLDYMNNPDFVTLSGETIAERMLYKQEILSRESELAAQEDSVGNPRPWRAQMIKRRLLEESTSAGNSSSTYSSDNELGLSRAETIKQQSAYTAASSNQDSGNASYAYSSDNVLGLSRSETVKQQMEYRAVTLQQNDASAICAEQAGRVSNNSGTAVSESNNRSGIAIFVANRNNMVDSAARVHGDTNEHRIGLVHAVVVEIPSDNERSREVLPLAEDARKVLPPYQQKRVWFIGAVVIGSFVTLIVLLPGAGNQPFTTAPMPSMSPMPSSSFIPSTFPSVSPSSIETFQQVALVQFYNVLAGEHWAVHDDWGSTSINMCNWHGVMCSTDFENNFVTEIILLANNLTGNIGDITLLGNLIYLEKLDLDSNSMSGNLTALSTTLASLSNLKYVDLRLNALTGSITNKLCDQIGSGILRVDCDIECACCNHEELCEEWCADVLGWSDSYGDNCTWYGNDQCKDVGNCCKNDGHTANTACCACGGGLVRLVNPSPSSTPSTIPSQSPLTLPSQHPSVSQNPTQSLSEFPSHRPTVSIQPTHSPSESPTTMLYQMQRGSVFVTLYDLTNGDDWYNNINWLSDAPICEWYGVDCNNDDEVIGIDLNKNNLQGSISSELGLLTNLRSLKLAFNSLRGSIPSELGLLINLQCLDLYGNSVKRSMLPETGLSTNVQNLALYDNSLTGSVPSELGLLANLQRLDLSYNSLTGRLPSEFGLLTNLRYLYVHGNLLTGIVFDEVCALHHGGNLKVYNLFEDCCCNGC